MITKWEMAQWFDCIAQDKRIPKDVRGMCADIVKRVLVKKKPKKRHKQGGGR